MAINFEDIICFGNTKNNVNNKYDHSLHITKESANINSVCSNLNNITDIMCSWFSKLDKNQKINQNYLETKVESIESKIDNLGSIINVDLNKEAKNQINNLVTKLETISFINNDGMNSPGDSDIPKLFYGTEDIMVLQTNTYNRTEYENIVEILDYWKKLYKDPDLGIDERNRLLDQIR